MNTFLTGFLLIVSFFLLRFNGFSQETIPIYSSLEKHQKITLQEDYSYLVTIEQTTLISDVKGLDHGHYSIDIDQFTKIEDFEARIIDPGNGKTIRKIRTKDLKDRATIGEGSVFEDSRIKYFTLENIPVPLRVEVALTLKKTGNFNLPKWYPNSYYFQQVKSSTLEVSYPESIGLRYKEEKLSGSAASGILPGWRKLRWEAHELPPLDKNEKDAELPFVALAPLKFAMEGYAATMDSWKSFGSWFNVLNVGRDELPEEMKTQVRELTAGVTDNFEKINILYKYLQKNYRYVSIQLGIGGWMSMKASEVVAMKYGDCKGLSMLMKSLLKEVGIPADYTLVLAGKDKDPIDEDFPSNQFNHVILRVPLPTDTLWLECTSSTLPPGYLGSFTKDRPVLVITESGGQLDRTPSYADSRYHQAKVSLQVDLMESGDAGIKGVSRFWGEPAEIFAALNFQLSEKDQKDFLNAHLGGRGLNLKTFQITLGQERDIPTAEISFEGMVARFSQNTAKRIIIPLSWSKLPIDGLNDELWEYEEILEINTEKPLVFEGEQPEWKIENPHYYLALETVLDANRLLINKKVKTYHYQETKENSEVDLLAAIQKEFQKQLVFIK